MRQLLHFSQLLCLVLAPAAAQPLPDEPYLQWERRAATFPARTPPAARRDWLAGAPRPPVPGPTVTGRGGGLLWAGGTRGAFCLDGGRWRYFAGRRWLPDDRVTDLDVATDGSARIRTAGGAVLVARRRMTLSEKAAIFERIVPLRHDRLGYVSGCFLPRAGDLAQSQRHSDDNDGLWTAMYVAAEALRYKATGSAEAAARARRHMEALLLLERITGRPGFPARSIDHAATRQHGGEWHPATDRRWQWKGDTSSDELVGHFLAFALYSDLVASADEKRRVAATAERILDHLLDHDLSLVDTDGKPTSWGRYARRHYGALDWLVARGLQALEILSHLKVGIHLTGKPRFARAYEDLVRQGYARYTVLARVTLPGSTNYSDDELIYLSYYPLLRYETDPALLRTYRRSLDRTWSKVRPERNALWTAIHAACGGKLASGDLAAARDTLRETPLDLVSWRMTNSHRQDVTLRSYRGRHGSLQLSAALSPLERRMHKHNGNPYTANGGDPGHGEEAPTFWLLPYWMLRAHGLLR